MDVIVTDSVLVKPVNSTPHHHLWVSNVDLVISRRHSAIAYIYRRPPSGDSFLGEMLKEALSKVLVEFYPLAGRLTVDGSGRICVDCNGEGALFVEAVTDSVIDDFGDFTNPSQLVHLVPSATYENGITTFPLLMIQVTKFKCGGVALGTGIQHILSDGIFSLHFVNSWCNVARGLQLHLLPQLDRNPLRTRNPPRTNFSHQEFEPSPSLLPQKGVDEKSLVLQEEAKRVSFGRFGLNKEQVSALKAKARANPLRKTYSTYVTLAAHIWKCCTTARGLGENQRCKLYIPIDGRDRLSSPHLPCGYFGNVIFMATQIDIAGEIVSNPLWFSAEKIHESVAKMDDEYLRSQLDFLELQPDLNALVRSGEVFKCPNMTINSWTRLPLYDADFGWGRPCVMGPARIPHEGHCYILPSPANDGDLFVCLGLQSDHMDNFGKLFYEF